MSSRKSHPCLYCVRCGEPWDFLQILNQDLHSDPEQASLANTLFLEGVGCPACRWGTKSRLVLPNKACWDALLCAVCNVIRGPMDDRILDAEAATRFADVLFHDRVPEVLSYAVGSDAIAFDWLFGNGFQHRLRAVADFARGGAFTVSQREDGRIVLSHPVDPDRSLPTELPAERLNAAKAAVVEIIEPESVLMWVLHSRMQARGFSNDETRAALDAIAGERLVYIRKFEHPVLKEAVLVGFVPDR